MSKQRVSRVFNNMMRFIGRKGAKEAASISAITGQQEMPTGKQWAKFVAGQVARGSGSSHLAANVPRMQRGIRAGYDRLLMNNALRENMKQAPKIVKALARRGSGNDSHVVPVSVLRRVAEHGGQMFASTPPRIAAAGFREAAAEAHIGILGGSVRRATKRVPQAVARDLGKFFRSRYKKL